MEFNELEYLFFPIQSTDQSSSSISAPPLLPTLIPNFSSSCNKFVSFPSNYSPTHPSNTTTKFSQSSATSKHNGLILLTLPIILHLISTKWIFRIKDRRDGIVERLKARLVAISFQQIAGVDYFHTFSPIIKPITFRIMFSLAMTKGWCIQQVDINNAFLHGKLNETVYIEQPKGFVDQQRPQHVCKLVKALYGLKQAPKTWYDTLNAFLVTFSLK